MKIFIIFYIYIIFNIYQKRIKSFFNIFDDETLLEYNDIKIINYINDYKTENNSNYDEWSDKLIYKMKYNLKEKIDNISKDPNDVPNSQNRINIDDHDGTPIGQGITVAILAAKLNIFYTKYLENNKNNDLKQGLFSKDAIYPVMIRISHTTVAGMDLMRIAMKIFPNDDDCFKDNDNNDQCEINLHFTETVDVFPIKNNQGLEVFVNEN